MSPAVGAPTRPTAAQILLLRAILLDDPPARDAWERWIAGVDLETVDGESARLLPQLYLRLRSLSLDHPEMVRLRGVHRSHWYRNAILTRELVALQAQLAAAGVPARLAKGAALSLGWYRDAGARPMHDAALLVPRGAVADAVKRLAAAGLAPVGRSPQTFTPAYLEARASHLLRSATGLEVEIVWRLFGRDVAAVDEGMQPGASIEVEGRAIPALDATELLLHLCAIAACEGAEPRAAWIADAAAILRTPAVDWARFQGRAIQLERGAEAAAALALLADELLLNVPRAQIEALAAAPRSWRRRVGARLGRGEVGSAVLRFGEHLAAQRRLRRTAPAYAGVAGLLRYLQEVHDLGSAAEVLSYYFRSARRTLRRRSRVEDVGENLVDGESRRF